MGTQTLVQVWQWHIASNYQVAADNAPLCWGLGTWLRQTPGLALPLQLSLASTGRKAAATHAARLASCRDPPTS